MNGASTISDRARLVDEFASQLDDGSEAVRELAGIARRPVTLEQTGLSLVFLGDLVAKHLAAAGTLSTGALIERLALAGPVMQQVLQFLRAEARIEVLARQAGTTELSYGLTDKGRIAAREAMLRGGYVGPAPITLSQYRDVIRAQSVHASPVSRRALHEAFRDVRIAEELLDRLGPALNSRRAIFIYGAPGTGKTYTARKLADAIGGLVLVPRAVLVQDTVIELFDPLVHDVIEFQSAPSPQLLAAGFDPRFVACERPIVLTGGELSADMLEVRFDPNTRCYTAPIQMKAANGFLLIDDLGRQRIDPASLFNRWIVPLESRQDWLTLASGQHFEIPFDLVLVLSTNLRPSDVADEAFLRRLGYKIEFAPISEAQYRALWVDVCHARGLESACELADYAIRELHRRRGVPLLPCHPRDLLGIAADRLAYMGLDAVDEACIGWAWSNYFAGEHARSGRAATGSREDES